jgi:hypothetical protein
MTKQHEDSNRTIHKVARIKDKATSTYFEVIEFPLSASETGALTLVPSVVNDLNQFEKQLRDAGAILPKDDEQLQKLLVSLAKSDAPEERVYEAHTGWIEDKTGFATVDGLIGVAPTNIVGVNRSNVIEHESGKLSTSGTWEGWRDDVGNLARFSSIMMFAICVAFAAPLLAFVKWPSFAICLFARTRVGKSITTLMAASVPGIGRIEDLITWNIKDARVEQRLAEYNDTIFPIDDLMGMAGKEKDKYLRIRDLAYKLSQGWATGRHDSFTKAHGGMQEHWRSIVLTSYEKSIRDLARAAKLERQHGEAVRLIDVPAIFDGLDHVFDRLPTNLATGNFQVWKKDTFKAIANASEHNHGEAFKHYIESLIADYSSVDEYVEARIGHFVKKVCDDFDGDVARDVAEKFGLIYAGGRLAIRCGLLPWDRGVLLDAIAKCYKGALELLPDEGVTLRHGIAALRTQLGKLPALNSGSKQKNMKLNFKELDGYRQRQESVRRYLIKREVFNSVFASTKEKTLVMEWLVQKQRITLAVADGTPGAAELMPKGQFIWRDGVRRRSYEILWPRGKGDKGSGQKKDKSGP